MDQNACRRATLAGVAAAATEHHPRNGNHGDGDTMSTTGRYFYRDLRSGRTFCIEPISDRTQKIDDQRWSNGGIDPVGGGAIREEDSIITPENGFTNIAHLPAGVSPDAHIETLLRGRG